MNEQDKKLKELEEVEAKRADLLNQKSLVESKLVAVKNQIRTSGRMPHEKYKQCCDAQNKYVKQIQAIEEEARKLKLIRRTLHVQLMGAGSVPPQFCKAPEPENELVRELAALRQHYQEFSADKTRVGSMRQMASEFVLKLNPIIKKLVNQ